MSRRSHSSPKAPEPEVDIIEPEVVIDEATAEIEAPEPEVTVEDVELEVEDRTTTLVEPVAEPVQAPAPRPQDAKRYSLDHALGAIDVHVEPEFDTNTILLQIMSPATGVALHLSPDDAGAIGGVLVNWALNHGFRA